MSLLNDTSLSCDGSSSLTESPPERGSGLIQTLIKDPLNLFYQFYYTMTEPIETTPLQTTESSPTTAPQRRLHPQAEDYRSSLLAGTASVVLKKSSGDNQIQLIDLPIGVLLNISMYLDVKTLCHLQQTCHHLCSLTSDELLWRRKLGEDSRQWEVVSHLSHPKVYQEVSSDLSAQEM